MHKLRAVTIAVSIEVTLAVCTTSMGFAHGQRSTLSAHRAVALTKDTSRTMDVDFVLPTQTGWRIYRNKAAGYEIKYPTSWTVRQQTNSTGTLTTFFVGPHHRGGVSISVLIDNGATASGKSEIPNTHCYPVMVNGASGIRCLDTFSRHTEVIFAHSGKSYYITATGKNFSNDVLNHMVSSLRFK